MINRDIWLQAFGFENLDPVSHTGEEERIIQFKNCQLCIALDIKKKKFCRNSKPETCGCLKPLQQKQLPGVSAHCSKVAGVHIVPCVLASKLQDHFWSHNGEEK